MPKVVIIILNWNGIRDTLECLTSLRKITYPNFKIIIIDNGSVEENIAMLRQIKDKNVQIIFNKENLGFAEANNIGIRAALKDPKVKYICTLNNDTVVNPNFLTEAVTLDGNMVAMQIMKYDQPDQVDSLGIALTRGGLAFNIKSDIQLFCPCAGAALYSRQLLEKVGLFDSDFFCYGEDLDLGFRARLLGFDCSLADKAIVYHKGSASTSLMSNTAVYYTYRNIIWTLAKNLPGLLFVKYLAKIILGQLAIVLLWFLRKKPKLILKTYWHGLKGILKMLSKRNQIQRKISLKNLEKHIVSTIFLKSYLKRLF
jgi:GT2 family glycosyltransferase